MRVDGHVRAVAGGVVPRLPSVVKRRLKVEDAAMAAAMASARAADEAAEEAAAEAARRRSAEGAAAEVHRR